MALRTRGPLTATQAARLLGESSGTCSFHLRQLARYGLAEEAGGGTGREKPWRATTTSTTWDDVPDTAEAAEAASLLSTVVTEWYFTAVRRWLEVRSGETEDWQRAAFLRPGAVRINYGTRPLGALLGGLLGEVLGLRAAPWIAVAGGVAGAALLIPSPLTRFRLPS